MEELLKAHTHLIMTFRTFLPKKYQISLDDNNDMADEAKQLERKLLLLDIRSRF
jgi:histone deacetylase complex regulatory component SIN3